MRSVELLTPVEAPPLLALADLFVEVYVRIDDAIESGVVPIPPHPGPTPAWSDAELLTLAVVRHRLARRSARRFLREVGREGRHSFPRVPPKASSIGACAGCGAPLTCCANSS